MAAAYAAFQHQTALLGIYSNHQTHSKIDLAVEKMPGGDPEETFYSPSFPQKPNEVEGIDTCLFFVAPR